MSVHKLLYVFTRAPYSSSAGQEALDAALIGAAFELDVTILFLHDGVFQLMQGQGSGREGSSRQGSGSQDSGMTTLKQFTKAFSALGDFGIEKVYVHDMSLHARGLDSQDLMTEVELLDNKGVQLLLNSQFRVFTF